MSFTNVQIVRQTVKSLWALGSEKLKNLKSEVEDKEAFQPMNLGASQGNLELSTSA